MIQQNIEEILASMINNLDLQLHILSHFTEIDESYKIHLLKMGAQIEDIDKQISLAGSKFNPEFAQNPLEILERIKSGPKAKYIEGAKQNSRKVRDLLIQFSPQDFDKGIGTDNIIHRSRLNSTELEEVKLAKRSDTAIHSIKKQPVSTWRLNIIFDKSNESEAIIKTIFPGTYAPPFPDRVQSKEEYNRSLEFWNNHVFLT